MRNISLIAASGFALVAMVALGLALTWRAADQARLETGRFENCQAIEEHKKFHRQQAAFNLPETRRILRDLGINPDSERGQRIIQSGRQRAARAQARFAATNC